ncbi:sensor histidine kinase [Microbacterium soli]|uniref:histidine kinase n=1 Tax=Microbacterium soli TaxID=446075 RepID=A0ABP7NG19_9MICO
MTEDDADPRRGWTLVGAGVAVLLLTVAAAGGAALGWGWSDLVETYTFTNLLIGAAFVLSGSVIGWHRPRNAVGVLFALAGLAHLISAACYPLVLIGVSGGWPAPLTRALAGLFSGSWPMGLTALALVALLRFPDGRTAGAPRWLWRVAEVWILVNGVLSASSGLVSPAPLIAGDPATVSLFAVAEFPVEFVDELTGVLGAPTVFLVIAAFVVRWRRGDDRARRQLLWLFLAFFAMLLLNSQRWLTDDGPILLLASTAFIPVAIGIAIVREQLLDIRLVWSRTLTYSLLILLVVGLYAGLVAAVASVVPPEADRPVTIVAAVAVALLFNPLRILLQRLISRAFFGTRGDPVRTAADVPTDGGLADVLAHLRATLRLSHLAVARDGRVLAEDGAAPPERDAVALAIAAEPGAELVIGLRSGERSLHRKDRQALTLVLPSIGLLLREQRLLEEVRRTRALSAQERERDRARLHRDLHDGLGPLLTGVALRLDAIANLVGRRDDRVDDAIARARAEVRLALDSVRRVVYGLRPVALGEGGLVGALQEQARGEQSPVVDVHVDEPLPELSPAVELTAYRIAMEALANARRHSRASAVSLTLRTQAGDLRMVIEDDGGETFGTVVPGAGIRSMRERAEELRGQVIAEPTARGWRVEATIPLA